MNGTPLGIVVVSYHSKGHLTDFVWSLLQAAPRLAYYINIQNVEVTDDEIELASGLTEMIAEDAMMAGLTNHRANCGYARACNDGARWLEMVSDGKIDTYAFFNADTLIKPDVLEHCVQTLWSDPDYGVLGPRQVDTAGRITHAGIFGTNRHPKHRGWYEPGQDGRYDSVDDSCTTVSGSAYFVKQPVWDELRDCAQYQMADPDSCGAFLQTPFYYEETWCSYHARSHGYKVVYDGAVTMVHKWMGSTPDRGWAAQQMIESREIFRQTADLHGIDHD